MLRLTDEQGAAINSARAAFNMRQTALAANSAFADGFGDTMTGNAAQVPLDAWRRIDSRSVQLQRDILAWLGQHSGRQVASRRELSVQAGVSGVARGTRGRRTCP